MNSPAIDKLIDRSDSKYSLVIAIAKRAREITDGDSSKIESQVNKEVSIALHEFDRNKFDYIRPEKN